MFQAVTERLYVQGKLKEFAIKYIQRRIRVYLGRKNKQISIRDRLALFFHCQIAAFRFKKARRQHTIPTEESREEAVKRLEGK